MFFKKKQKQYKFKTRKMELKELAEWIKINYPSTKSFDDYLEALDNYPNKKKLIPMHLDEIAQISFLVEEGIYI